MDDFAEQFGLPGSEDWKPRSSELENLEGIEKEDLPKALKEEFSAGCIELMKRDALINEDYELANMIKNVIESYVDRFTVSYVTILDSLITCDVAKFIVDNIEYYHADFESIEDSSDGQLIKMYRDSTGVWKCQGRFQERDILQFIGAAIDRYEAAGG